jgi:Ribbon-helix-helix protein, copG family
MTRCMRTTVRLPDDLMAQARKVAAETGRTLTRVMEDALREAFARRRPSGRKPPVRLPTVRGRGLQGGIDLDDTASLVDAMEDRDGPP